MKNALLLSIPLFISLALCACADSDRDRVSRMVKEGRGKRLFSLNIPFLPYRVKIRCLVHREVLLIVY